MKKMQTRFLKIFIPFLFFFGAIKASPIADLKRADSLFKAKQYTQSFDNYQLVLDQKFYSPSMLLKMAFIQEGLGHISRSIYFLQLYHKATHDEQALEKIRELASKNKLEGYEADSFSLLMVNLNRYKDQISGVLIALVLLLMSAAVYQKRKNISPIGALVGMVIFLALLFVQLNLLTDARQGIVSQPSTYLMSGPSAGASVIAIIEEGHQLRITGKKDIWLRVEWLDQEVYVKQDRLLQAEI